MAQKLDHHDVKVICWVPAPAACVYYLFGPAGGFGSETRAVVEAEMQSSGRDFPAVASEVRCVMIALQLCIQAIYMHPDSLQRATQGGRNPWNPPHV